MGEPAASAGHGPRDAAWRGVVPHGLGMAMRDEGMRVRHARARRGEAGKRSPRAQLTPTARLMVGPISALITRSAIGSWSVGSRLTMTRSEPFCLAMIGNPAAG